MKLRGGRHLSATLVARMCGVDLKTIHNWVDRGKLPALRTRGGHHRFWLLDVAEFLRAYELGVPEELAHARLHVVVIDGDAGTLLAARRALARRFEVVSAGGVVEGLVATATLRPDVLVAGDVAPLDVPALGRGLLAAEATRHVRVLACSDVGTLRERIEALLTG